MSLTKMKIGLAFGGGGARGMAHIGVLKVLEQNNIPIDFIAGTSIGALVGAVYAQHPDAILLESRVTRYIESPEFKQTGLERFRRKEPAENFFGQVAKYVRERVVINLAHSRLSIVGKGRMQRVVEAVLDDTRLEETLIPLVIVATDLLSGKDRYLRYGSIREAAMASASIPGFLPPIEMNGNLLVDGAVTSPIPVRAVRSLGADFVIAVDVGQDLNEIHETQSIIDIMFRTNSITSNKLKNMILENADVVIRPKVGHVHWADFQDIEYLIAEGEQAARKAMPAILRSLKLRRPIWQKILHFNARAKNDEKMAEMGG